jgi:hypothetical protein
MKKSKIILILGLALVFAASFSVFAASGCSDDLDCDDSNVIEDYKCANNSVYINYSAYYFCNYSTGACQLNATPSWRIDYNCSELNTQACLDGDLYKIDNNCRWDIECLVENPVVIQPNSPTCDYTAACIDPAMALTSPLADVTYDVDFDDEYTIDNGAYIVVPGTSVSLSDISTVYFLCANGAPVPRGSNLIAWVYNTTSNAKLAMANNNIEISNSLTRNNLIGSGSLTRGTPILNPFTMLLGYYMDNEEINNIYSFTRPSNYTVYIDLISGWCEPNDGDNYNTAANYVCPWLGGTNRANLCWANGVRVEGWRPKQNFTVLVPNPDINFTAPSNGTNVTGTKIQKTWTIRNTGIGRTYIAINYICGNWTCAFDGYKSGGAIPLNVNETFTVTMNITLGAAEVNHLIGINVSYDDGYGLSAITPKLKTSNISITSTSAAAVAQVSVALNQPAAGSTVPNNVALNYTVTGSNSTYNVSLNLNGSANNQTDVGKLNNTLYGFALVNLGAGVYWWNVTAYINNSVYATSETRNFTVTSTTLPWVIVTSNQPLPGSIVPNNLTLNYTINGSNNTYNVSLNLNGNINNQTDIGKLNNTQYSFTVMNLGAGLYWWNVTGYIDNTVYNTSDSRNFTVVISPTTIYYIT